MHQVGHLNHKEFKTIIKLTEEVKNFLTKNHIDLNLGERFPSAEYWYKNILFQKPENKNHKNFELVYFNLHDKKENEENLDKISESLGIKEKDSIILDGSAHILEIEPKTFIRWIVKKADSR